jgi:hypothetical protein
MVSIARNLGLRTNLQRLPARGNFPICNPAPYLVPLTAQRNRGIISLGNQAFVTNASKPLLYDLAELLANPNCYNVASVNLLAGDLAPTQSTTNFTNLNTVLGILRTYNMTATKKATLKLRIYGGQYCSPELLAQSGTISLYNDSLAAYVTLPQWWTIAYQAAWRQFIALIAPYINSIPEISAVCITSCAMNTAEPFVTMASLNNTPIMDAAGYTDIAYINNLVTCVQDYDPITLAQLVLPVLPFSFAHGGSQPTYSAQVLQLVMTTGRLRIGNRVCFQNTDMNITGYASMNAAMQLMGGPLSAQTAGPTYSPMETAALCLQYNFDSLELFDSNLSDGFAPNNASTILPASLMLGGGG